MNNYRLRTTASAEQALEVGADMLDELGYDDCAPGEAELFIERVWPDEQLVYTD